MAYLWDMFLDLHAFRTINGMVAAPATHQDIFAWRANLDLLLEPWEVRALMRLGRAWKSAMDGKAANTNRVPPPPSVPPPPVAR